MAKTSMGLVEYAYSKLGTAYVYGAKMEILTKDKYDFLRKTYGTNLVWGSDVGKIGRMCCDCSGLISAYTGKARSSTEYRNAAMEVYPISSIANAPPGALVWKQGHIGIHVGVEKGVHYYIAEDGSAYGCRKQALPASFTHWFLCPDVRYPAEIAAGSTVSVITGACYGGLTSVRGKAVPASVLGRRLTVGKIDTHNGVKEALLKEINSWVPVESLNGS